MFPLQQREMLLSEPAGDGDRFAHTSPSTALRAPSGSSCPSSASSTSLRLAAEWKGSAAPPNVSFVFRPFFAHERFFALGRHRHYPWLMLLAFLLQIGVDLQTWLPPYAQIAAMCCVELLINVPLTLVECTRLDRTLLHRLVRSWSFLYLIANHGLAILMQFLLTPRDVSASDVAFLVLANFFWARLSIYIMSMDALVGVKRRWKLGFLAGFVTFLVVAMLQQRRSHATESDMEICLIQCTTARNIQAAAMLNLALFMFKFIGQLVRRADAVMIISPAVTLKQHEGGDDDADSAEGDGNKADEPNQGHMINEAIL